MTESLQISRKRMRFSSSSASETLLASKSQYQRHRSGRIEPTGDGLRFNQSPSVTGKITPKVLRTYPRVTIKDLRLRRVFTPSSIWEFKTKEQQSENHLCDSNVGEEGTKVDAGGLGNEHVKNFLKTTPLDSDSGPICEESNGSVVKRSGTTVCHKPILRPCSRAKIFKNPGSFSYKRLLPYLMQAADGTPSGHEPIKAECGNTSPLKKVVASSPNKKSACSRRKLFKTPGSVNYRRMLPYLKDIQEDNPCVLETVNHPDHNEDTEGNTPSPMLASENEGAEDMVTENVTRELDTDKDKDKDKELVPCEAVFESPERSDTDKEQETQVKHVIPDTEKNLETPQNALGSEVQFSSPIAGSGDSSEVALNNPFVQNLAGEETMKTDAKNREEQVEANSSDLTAELLDPSAVSGTPTSVSPSKGILKRSIRGCRGICSCLNCSSFRLNAERAFEFSRNQLQDTEVLVLDLLGEISLLKESLEKQSSAHHNESYKIQAGEAAKRANEAADLAKSRLYQMNDDLQVHCRIPNEQRAKVKFAHYVHEKTILQASQLDP
ncbi:BnaAnng19050D [Brassica napus]|uniref:BnaAnng19050D protein n=1 Tax=Brassica napus TaxID=3708 RepID=A0A078JCG3_BRANA|nr:BnaAnng19050D [Brassica napus]